MRFLKLKTSLFLVIIVTVFNAWSFQGRMEKNSVNIGIIGQSKGFDPRDGYTYLDFLVIQCLYQTLVRIDGTGRVSSDLASSWQISDDGKIYTFNINPFAVFTNGQKVSAKDVALSYARHSWPSSKSIVRGYLESLVIGQKGVGENQIPPGFKIINDSILEIHLLNPYPAFLHILTMPAYSILSIENLKKNNYIGSGHLEVKSIDKDKLNKISNIVLAPNEKYLGTRSKINELKLTHLQNFEEVVNQQGIGDNDILVGVPLDSASSITLPSNYEFHFTESLTYGHFFFNMKKETNHNLKFRETLGKYLNQLAHGAVVNNKVFNHLTTFLPRDILPKDYYERTFLYNKSRLSKNFFKNEFRIIFPSGRLPEKFILSMKDGMKKIKNLKIEELPMEKFRQRLGAGEYELSFFGYVGNFSDPDGFFDSIRENNFPGVSLGSDNFLNEIEKIKFSNNPVERLKNYAKSLRSFEDQWTLAPLFQMNIPVIKNKKIKVPETLFKYETELWNFLWEK